MQLEKCPTSFCMLHKNLTATGRERKETSDTAYADPDHSSHESAIIALSMIDTVERFCWKDIFKKLPEDLLLSIRATN